ncbi:MAG: hypothetical protein V4582_23910 [Pseudomonadota bacterium]
MGCTRSWREADANCRHALRARIAAGVAGLCLLLCGERAVARENIPLYTYYADAPFGVDVERSLTVKLALWMSKKSQGRYQFIATYIPRLRLDKAIGQPDWRGVVAWTNPNWFDDGAQTKYLWTRGILHDASLVVSLRAKPVLYENSDSLNGLKLGGILGRHYVELGDYLKSGQIVRDDGHSEQSNLLKLKLGRLDVTFVQMSDLAYHRRTYPDLDQWLYIAPKPRDTFSRHLFVNSKRGDLLRFLNSCIGDLAHDQEWGPVVSASNAAMQLRAH